MTQDEAVKRAADLNGRRPGGSMVTYEAQQTVTGAWRVVEFYTVPNDGRLVGGVVVS